ncbi:MAG: purE [Sporomusa sp.]|nr:purE [Sporomusa sp.]
MKVAIIMGSDSDWPILEPAVTQLDQFGIKTEVLVASAHRTPDKVHKFVAGAQERGVKVIIAAAGAAAHLPGVIASFTTLPVIGIPVNATPLGGMDALLSIVQMPAGIPVATMASNGAKNAALFAAQILAVHDAELTNKLAAHRQDMADEVEKKDARLAEKISAKNS